MPAVGQLGQGGQTTGLFRTDCSQTTHEAVIPTVLSVNGGPKGQCLRAVEKTNDRAQCLAVNGFHHHNICRCRIKSYIFSAIPNIRPLMTRLSSPCRIEYAPNLTWAHGLCHLPRQKQSFSAQGAGSRGFSPAFLDVPRHCRGYSSPVKILMQTESIVGVVNFPSSHSTCS